MNFMAVLKHILPSKRGPSLGLYLDLLQGGFDLVVPDQRDGVVQVVEHHSLGPSILHKLQQGRPRLRGSPEHQV